MKCQILFSRKNNKTTSICHLLKFLPRVLSVKGKHILLITLQQILSVNSFSASGHFCRLLITFSNSLDPDHARSGSKLFDTLMIFLKDCFEKVNILKKIQGDKKHDELLSTQRVKSSSQF